MRQARFELLHGLRRRRLDACRTQLAAVRRFGDDLENQLSETVRAAGSVVAEQRLAIGPGELVIERMSDCRRRRAELQQAERMLSRRRDLVDEVTDLARSNLEDAVRQVEVIERLVEKVSE